MAVTMTAVHRTVPLATKSNVYTHNVYLTAAGDGSGGSVTYSGSPFSLDRSDFVILKWIWGIQKGAAGTKVAIWLASDQWQATQALVGGSAEPLYVAADGAMEMASDIGWVFGKDNILIPPGGLLLGPPTVAAPTVAADIDVNTNGATYSLGLQFIIKKPN